MKKILLLLMVSLLSSCGYNTLQQQDEEIKASWSEVLNQYQRRADLVPNLVNAVKGYASHEASVFQSVTEARAKVSSIQVSPETVNNPENLAAFSQAQTQLSGALGRLIAVSENYPNLKADANFRDLQAQLEGTENRIAVARNRYIQSVRDYNVTVRSFPTNLIAKMSSMTEKANFTVENEAAVAKPPVVDFNK